LEKRKFERLEASLDTRMLYGDMIYTARVMDLSESGMFVSTKLNFAVDAVVMIVVQLEDDTIKVPVKVRRNVKADAALNPGSRNGMGVEVLERSDDYLEYIRRFRSDNASGLN
jgi:Tfp pilus assembly protein PilZ